MINRANRTVYIVPIEPLEERYTAQWYKNVPQFFEDQGENVVVVDGMPLSTEVKVGTFLDINSTVAYKNSQLVYIARMFHEGIVQAGDIFYFADIEFWGLESVRLMAQLNGIEVSIYGFLHAASYTVEDAFAVAAPYQKYTELGWIASCDGVFVGSNYHKQAVIDRRIVPYADPSDRVTLANKIFVTGNPLFESDYAKIDVKKKHQIIISNRFDYEKRPNLSLDLALILKQRDPTLEILVTTSRPVFKSNKAWLVDFARAMESMGIITIYDGLSKAEYHKHLAESKVFLSNSIEESFGYCLVEACVYDVAPMCANKYSHSEILQGNMRFMFEDEDEIVPKIEDLLKTDIINTSEYATPYYRSLSKMWNIMKVGAGKKSRR